jgi:Protein of unknown function (DUF1592)/Protein of unknown function (DUF1588)/Protein of unknown function (DUF1587)/Protein of unknown function (DUF1595)/Protein of unknown function (DUF1585)/Planctomycete cytochrome C
MFDKYQTSIVLFVLGFWIADKTQAQLPIKPIEGHSSTIQLLQEFCVRCHNAETMKSGVRLDQLTADFAENQLFLWKDVLAQISDEAMPPEDEKQPTAVQRENWVQSIREAMNAARARNSQKNGSVRRLTVAQYRNTLRSLLGIDEDLTDSLPPDGISKDGFANNGQVLGLSPLQMEYYFEIAEQALKLSIVDEKAKPSIQNFRVDIGKALNAAPCKDNLILGANNLLLENQDFEVHELAPPKPFAYEPFRMQRSFDFIEGYEGNGTVRGWRKFESIYHAVFACMRGTEGYPKGRPYEVVKAGLLLRPAIPSTEIFGQSSTYGPHANFKVSLRELPDHGNFRVTVKAARFNDALLLEDTPVSAGEAVENTLSVDFSAVSETHEMELATAGVYQVDLIYELAAEKTANQENPKQEFTELRIGERSFANKWPNSKPADSTLFRKAFMLLRLPGGKSTLAASLQEGVQLRRVEFKLFDETSEAARRFVAFENRSPQLGISLGLRRDCGSTLKPVGTPQPVSTSELKAFVFEGAIGDFPSPFVEKENVNYLAGIREIGVRSEYTDGRDIPRLLIGSVEFEGPLYETWPPESHRNIFIESPNKNDSSKYAGEVIRRFLKRAYRRPALESEVELIHCVWEKSFKEHGDFSRGLQDALLVVLTSPQFLFLVEKSASPEAEDLDEYELASKLSYFLWNAPPDERQLQLAARGELRQALDVEIERMLTDQRIDQFLQPFVSQWLSLDKFDVVEVDHKRFPRLTRDTRTQLREEPIQFVKHLIENNLPLSNLVRSEFVVANDSVAAYYGLAERTESGFSFAALEHRDPNLGGLLSQASILSGLSDGRESNPVKRGAWFARKIIADPPDDPPPNVPELKEAAGTALTLRERLEMHRNQEGCAKCHSSIDPWGIPFETIDAAGRFKQSPVDARSTLPDGTEIHDLNSLKEHLATEKLDRVAFSVLKHLASYATGRTLSYNEVEFLDEQAVRLRSTNYPTRELVQLIIKSDIFLKK